MLTIAVVGRKGGSGKTTTALNLAGVWVEREHTVLLVDLDPQASLSRCLGISPGERTLSEVFARQGKGFGELITEVPGFDGRLHVVPADRGLAIIDKGLDEIVGREFLLRRSLDTLPRTTFDYCLVDCPPGLGYMTTDGLVACRFAILPIDTSVFGLQAAADTLSLARQVREVLNPTLVILGLLVNNIKPHTVLERETLQALRNPPPHGYGELLFETVVPISIKLKEALEAGLPYVFYDPSGTRSRLAGIYRRLADEVEARIEREL